MLTNSIGVDRLRAYSRTQQQQLADKLQSNGVTPLLLKNRGAYVLIEHQDGREAVNRLKANGINADARPLPGTDRWVVRLCPDMLNTNAELEESARRIAKALA